MKTTDPPIIVEHLFNASVETVWRAITESTQMVKWFFDNIPDFKAEVGFKTQFNVKAPSQDFLHLWEITEVIPQQKIVYNWKYQDTEGESFVIFELSQVENHAKLVLTTEVIEDFDDTIPEFRYESGVAGWTYFIKEQLPNYLENKHN